MSVLQGIRVLDLSTIVAGPAASMILADLGAEVIKVERVGTGEDGRAMGPHRGPWGAYFTALNRGKRSIAIDITKPEGKAAVLRIAGTSDVWLENFRGGAAEKLGLDEAIIRQHSPEIVYAALSAYGPSGPDYTRPGYDAILQARTGIMSVTGDGGGQPVRAGVSVLDMGTGIWMALGILAALLERKSTGKGQRVDASLFQTGVMFMAYHLLYRQFAGVNPQPQGSRHTAFAPYGAYRAADGFLMIGISSDKAFARLCAALGHAEWAADSRFLRNPDRVRNTPILDSLMNEVLGGKASAEWKQILDAADVAVDPVQTAEQVLDDPQVAALNLLASVSLSGQEEQEEQEEQRDALVPRLPLGLSQSPPEIQGPPPKIGEHTEAILREAGFADDEIAQLKLSKCIGAEQMPYGRYFEELEVGQRFKHWPGRTIQEYDDTLLSLLSMNQHPVHHDAHYAQASQHGRRLVAGPVVISLAIGLSQADIGGRALATRSSSDVRHQAPAFHGDTIYAESRVLEKKLISADRGEVEIETRANNQRGESVLSMRRVLVVPTTGGK